MVRGKRMVILSLLLLACLPATAGASMNISAWTSGERLTVSRNGTAQITWREHGRTRTAIVRGDRVTYRGRIGKHAGRAVRPSVAYGVAEVVLPDGTHFALQRIRRLGQFGARGAPELRFARWRGAKPRLALTGEWAYNGKLPRICGTATYHGRPFFGARHTLSGRPLDALGRNVYIDVLRPGGWFRIMGVLTRPRGFALLIRTSEWRGVRYRALVPGPNVEGDLAPDVTASTALPAAGVRSGCPFETGLYKNA